MKIKSWLAVPAVLILGAGLTLAIPAMSAVGQSSPPAVAVQIKVNSVALLGGGLAVKLPVRYICPTGDNAQGGSAQLSEAVHKAILTATAQFPVTCNGTFQHIDLVLYVQGQSFKPGTALAAASIYVCNYSVYPYSCSTTSAAHSLVLT